MYRAANARIFVTIKHFSSSLITPLFVVLAVFVVSPFRIANILERQEIYLAIRPEKSRLSRIRFLTVRISTTVTRGSGSEIEPRLYEKFVDACRMQGRPLYRHQGV